MNKAFLIISKTSHRYGGDLFSYAFGECLRRVGFDPIWLWRDSAAPVSSDDDIVINFGRGMAPSFRRMRGRKFIYNFHPSKSKLSRDKNKTKGGKTLPVWDLTSEEYFEELKSTVQTGGAEAVLEYNLPAAEELNKEGVRAVYTPVGYHESFEIPEKTKPLDIPKGVYFLGVPRGGHRSFFINELCAEVFQGDGTFHKTQDRLLCTDGVHIDMPHTKWHPFLSLRVIMRLMSNKRAVLCEEPDWSPLIDGEHYVEFKKGSLQHAKEKAQEMLTDNKTRRSIAEEGYTFIKKNHRLDEAVEKSFSELGVL